jgi:hypothetical protein
MLQHHLICPRPFQRGARLNACCRCGAEMDVQRVDCMKGYEFRKTNSPSRKEEPGHFLCPVQVHMQHLRAERGSWMGSMRMAGRMKRVEVIGLGELYEVSQSVQSKHLHQNPQISCRHTHKMRPVSEERSWPHRGGCISQYLIRAPIKTSACFLPELHEFEPS